MGWSATYFTTIIIEGNAPNTGIFIYSPSPGAGNLIGSWAAQAGTDQFGNNYPQGIFVKQGVLSGAVINNLCSIAGTPIAGSALSGCSYNGGTIKETVITFDSTGGSLFGYATTTSTTTITTSGNFTTPATSTPLTIDCYAGGAGGIYGGNHGGGGGGGEWARDVFTYAPSTVIPVVIGAGGTGGTPSVFAASGGNTTFNGTDVVAHGGQKGNHQSGGPGGTGSSNQFHNDGGRGGNTANFNGCGGGGGGGSGSPNGTGRQGGDNAGFGTAPGGAALGPGGAGGQGGSGSDGIGTGAINGTNGTVPGGGGGGGGSNQVAPSANGGAGVAGKCVVVFSTSSALVLSVSPISGTDPLTSAPFPAGFMGQLLQLLDVSTPAQVSGSTSLWSDNSGYPHYLSGDTNDTTQYSLGENILVTTAAQTITSTSATPVTGLSQTVGIGQYYFSGIIRLKQGATNVNQNIGLQGPTQSAGVWYQHVSQQAGANGITFVQGIPLAAVAVAFAAANDEDYWYFEGTVTFSAAGTLQVIASEGTAGDTFTIQPGSFLRVRPIR